MQPITDVKSYLYVVQPDDLDGVGAIADKFGVEPKRGFDELRRANLDGFEFATDENGWCSFQNIKAGDLVKIPAWWPDADIDPTMLARLDGSPMATAYSAPFGVGARIMPTRRVHVLDRFRTPQPPTAQEPGWGGQDLSIMVNYVEVAARRAYNGPNAAILAPDRIEAFITQHWPSMAHLQSFIVERSPGQADLGEVVAWMYLCSQFGIHCA